MVAQFNTGQRKVFDQVMAPINQPTNLLRQFFFYGPGGTEKTFMYNIFSATSREAKEKGRSWLHPLE